MGGANMAGSSTSGRAAGSGRVLRWLWSAALVLLIGCGDSGGDETPTPDAGGGNGDAEMSAGPACQEAADCNDGLFCNGAERCEAGRCVDGEAPDCDDGIDCTRDRCDETSMRCVSVPADEDGDGHPSADCDDGQGAPLGDDCDDHDAQRFPGNVEVCDPLWHDEDCDEETIGQIDEDDDGFLDDACCNLRADGTANCGGDCDDTRPSVRPDATEACDGADNDCDGLSDEAVLQTIYPDVDGDGFGVDGGTIEACGIPAGGGWALVPGDCDDAAPAVHQGAREVCNSGVDDDCDGEADVGCECDPGDTLPCGEPDGDGGFLDVGACHVGEQICAGGKWSGCVGAIYAGPELCEGRVDEDCDGSTDEGVVSTCYADPDDDGFAAMGAAPREFCSVDGREEEGGCPVGFTDRDSGLAPNDCDDGNAGIVPGATETCDDRDQDCDGLFDEGLRVDCYADPDNDGFAEAGTTAADFCPAPGREGAGGCPVGFSPTAPTMGSEDCAPGAAAVFPGATETCNAVDDDCDGSTDEALTVGCWADPDDDGYAEVGAAAADFCPVIGREAAQGCPVGFTADDPAGGADCTEVNAAIYPGATETCNGADDDCDDSVDEMLTVTCWADPDDDGYAVTGAQIAGFCPVTGREAEGGCPVGFTPDDPADTGSDCSEVSAQIHPGAVELCDGVDADCDGTADEAPTPNCDASQAFSACHQAQCVVFGCQGSYADCDDIQSNGCEADTQSDPAHCGGCGIACPDGISCSGGVCDIEPLVQISIYREHTCGVTTAGDAYCWGANDDGQLGNGERIPSGTPVQVLGGIAFSQIVAGWGFTCARDVLDDVYCWGGNNRGQLGNGGNWRGTPLKLGALSNIIDIDGSRGTACGVTDIGEVWCWGDNLHGQRGDGNTGTGITPTQMVGIDDAVEVATGERHTCVLRESGEVWCVGDNDVGQLAQPLPGGDPTYTTAVAKIDGLPAAKAVSAGEEHTCIISNADEVWCWGHNQGGQAGTGSDPQPPTLVAGTGTALEVAAGNRHSCVRNDAGEMRCWGANDEGQLGTGVPGASASPALVQGLVAPTAIATSKRSVSCALGGAGQTFCWGRNDEQQLGNGSTEDANLPTAPRGLASAVVLTTELGRSCARLSSGAALCWGNAGTIPGVGVATPLPAPVDGLPEVVDIQVSWEHACGLTTTGEVYCWGSNSDGQLGSGDTSFKGYPTLVQNLPPVVQLAVGKNNTCARTGDGQVYCWGHTLVALATGGNSAPETLPVDQGIGDAVDVVLADRTACVRTRSGRLRCWGWNSVGQLGRGHNNNQASRQLVPGLFGVVEVAAGLTHLCARTADGVVRCWGEGDAGRLGTGGVGDQYSPTPVFGLEDVAALSLGGSNSCARDSVGQVWCWGDNAYGQLGDGGSGDYAVIPRQLDGLFQVRQVTMGTRTAGLLFEAGPPQSWGGNHQGQLGRGTITPFEVDRLPISGL